MMAPGILKSDTSTSSSSDESEWSEKNYLPQIYVDSIIHNGFKMTVKFNAAPDPSNGSHAPGFYSYAKAEEIICYSNQRYKLQLEALFSIVLKPVKHMAEDKLEEAKNWLQKNSTRKLEINVALYNKTYMNFDNILETGMWSKLVATPV